MFVAWDLRVGPGRRWCPVGGRTGGIVKLSEVGAVANHISLMVTYDLGVHENASPQILV